MKNKEKQIIEKAIDILYDIDYFYKGLTREELENKIKRGNYYDVVKLVKLGYRKIDENSVVLTEREHEIAMTHQYDVGFGFGYKKGSKETAEKIICLIKTFCPDKNFIETITRIISERLGVEIKE
jgi:hypothetical protein